MSVSLVMPSLGESVTEGTITKWLVHEGDPWSEAPGDRRRDRQGRQ